MMLPRFGEEEAMRTNSNRHEVLEMLHKGTITVDEAVMRLQWLDGRLEGSMGRFPGGRRPL